MPREIRYRREEENGEVDPCAMIARRVDLELREPREILSITFEFCCDQVQSVVHPLRVMISLIYRYFMYNIDIMEEWCLMSFGADDFVSYCSFLLVSFF